MSKIIIITETFPFLPDENTFILPELEGLKKNHKIEIITAGLNVDSTTFCKNLDLNNIKVTKVKYPKFGMKHKLKILLKCFLSIEYYKNIFSSKCNLKTFLKRESECRNFYLSAYYLHKFLKKNNYFNKENISKTIFYSFWSHSNLLALCLEKKKNKNLKIVSRAHGYDLYNERMRGGHQPYKTFMDKMVDKQLFVSNLGKKYYIDHFANDTKSSKYILSYLGIKDNGIQEFKINNIIKIISCSNLIPLKRVELIIDELSLIKDKKINWVHFGDGELKETLKELAKKKLKNNISYEFKGFVKNSEIIDYYKKNSIDLFIHLSETEGCPVCISEAVSFGIPVIATDAGGVDEIVSNEIGKLIPINFKKGTVADFIAYYSNLSKEEILKYRENARKIFLEKFDSKNNLDKVSKIFDNLCNENIQ